MFIFKLPPTDEVAMMVVKENRALLRHHVNCFGEMEPLS